MTKQDYLYMMPKKNSHNIKIDDIIEEVERLEPQPPESQVEGLESWFKIDHLALHHKSKYYNSVKKWTTWIYFVTSENDTYTQEIR